MLALESFGQALLAAALEARQSSQPAGDRVVPAQVDIFSAAPHPAGSNRTHVPVHEFGSESPVTLDGSGSCDTGTARTDDLRGAFHGPGHEEAWGVFDTTGRLGAFGAKRSASGWGDGSGGAGRHPHWGPA
ncbi:MAG: hypothetical protein OXH79_09165 [Boseongicola sp.]|nr:hypothetical protein [Boseongicola sp.]